jgi:hypothetical protein
VRAYSYYYKNNRSEAAILVIADNAQEAKKIGWKDATLEMDEYIDCRVSRLKPAVEARALEIYGGVKAAHANVDALTCTDCGKWGGEFVDSINSVMNTEIHLCKGCFYDRAHEEDLAENGRGLNEQ